MSLIRDEHNVEVGDQLVTVRGETGAVAARWRLLVDGRDADTIQLVRGEHTLRATLSDGSTVEAWVRQSVVGPTTVKISHGDEVVGTFTGFVA